MTALSARQLAYRQTWQPTVKPADCDHDGRAFYAELADSRVQLRCRSCWTDLADPEPRCSAILGGGGRERPPVHAPWPLRRPDAASIATAVSSTPEGHVTELSGFLPGEVAVNASPGSPGRPGRTPETSIGLARSTAAAGPLLDASRSLSSVPARDRPLGPLHTRKDDRP